MKYNLSIFLSYISIAPRLKGRKNVFIGKKQFTCAKKLFFIYQEHLKINHPINKTFFQASLKTPYLIWCLVYKALGSDFICEN